MDSSQIMGALIHHGQSFGKTLHSTKRSTKIHPEQTVLITLDSTFQNLINFIPICFCVALCFPRYHLCNVDFPFTVSGVVPPWWSCCLVFTFVCLWISQSKEKHSFPNLFHDSLSSITAKPCVSFEESAKFIGCFSELGELEMDGFVCLAESWLSHCQTFPPIRCAVLFHVPSESDARPSCLKPSLSRGGPFLPLGVAFLASQLTGSPEFLSIFVISKCYGKRHSRSPQIQTPGWTAPQHEGHFSPEKKPPEFPTIFSQTIADSTWVTS